MARSLKSKRSVTLDQNIIDGIEALAEEESRSFSQYVNNAAGFYQPAAFLYVL